MGKRALDLRIGWCVSNIALLVPVLIPLFVGRGLPVFIPGLFSYCYALLAVGYYIFDQHIRITTQIINYVSMKKSFALLAMIGIIVSYVLYNAITPSFGTVIVIMLGIAIFVISFLLAYYLNLPFLKRQEVEEEQRDQDIQHLVESRQKTRDGTRKDVKAVVEEELK